MRLTDHEIGRLRALLRERALQPQTELIHWREALAIVQRACAGEPARDLHFDYQGRNADFIDGVCEAVRIGNETDGDTE